MSDKGFSWKHVLLLLALGAMLPTLIGSILL